MNHVFIPYLVILTIFMSGYLLQDEVKAAQPGNNRVMHRSLPAASGRIRIWNRTSNTFRVSIISR